MNISDLLAAKTGGWVVKCGEWKGWKASFTLSKSIRATPAWTYGIILLALKNVMKIFIDISDTQNYKTKKCEDLMYDMVITADNIRLYNWILLTVECKYSHQKKKK